MRNRPSRYGFEIMESYHCEQPGCSTCALFDTAGPDDPAWRARIRIEWQAAPQLIGRAIPPPLCGWSKHHACCVVCGTTEADHASRGRCGPCARYLRHYGTERPERLWNQEQRAS